MELEHRAVNVIRRELALAEDSLRVVLESAPSELARFLALHRVDLLLDELLLAEAYFQAMAEQVAQKWIYRYGPAIPDRIQT